ncbi:MAG: response regulator transcription factor [Mycobacterium sp.]
MHVDPITPIMLRPKPIRALNWAWTGRLKEAWSELTDVWNGCAFERARTQLLVGQLQRRRRRTQPARAALNAAAAVFEELGSPLWAGHAQRELHRLERRAAGGELTETERQVAEHAAAGMTNNEIAAVLYISAKTVEMHLSSAYRKLGVRSRTQLVERLRENGFSGR